MLTTSTWIPLHANAEPLQQTQKGPEILHDQPTVFICAVFLHKSSDGIVLPVPDSPTATGCLVTLLRRQSSYHHGDLRRALLNAGRLMIAEAGASHLSLREVARRIGVTHAAPYRHFPDKEHLIAAIAAEGYEALGHRLEECVTAHPGTPRERLLSLGIVYVRFAIEHPADYRAMFSGGLTDLTRHPELLHAAMRTGAYLPTAVVNAQIHGELFPSTDGTIPNAAWAIVHGLALLMLDGLLVVPESTELDEWVRGILLVLHAGFATDRSALVPVFSEG